MQIPCGRNTPQHGIFGGQQGVPTREWGGGKGSEDRDGSGVLHELTQHLLVPQEPHPQRTVTTTTDKHSTVMRVSGVSNSGSSHAAEDSRTAQAQESLTESHKASPHT